MTPEGGSAMTRATIEAWRQTLTAPGDDVCTFTKDKNGIVRIIPRCGGVVPGEGCTRQNRRHAMALKLPQKHPHSADPVPTSTDDLLAPENGAYLQVVSTEH